MITPRKSVKNVRIKEHCIGDGIVKICVLQSLQHPAQHDDEAALPEGAGAGEGEGGGDRAGR